MSSIKKGALRAGLAFGLVLLALQFFRPEKNLSASSAPGDLLAQHPAPPGVKQLLAAACYDCHSNHTRYPWYAGIQPVGWWLARHVRDGRQALNFSTFASLSARRARSKLEACIDQLETKTMPLPSYTITHHDARLTDAQIKTLVAWLEDTLDQIDAATLEELPNGTDPRGKLNSRNLANNVDPVSG